VSARAWRLGLATVVALAIVLRAGLIIGTPHFAPVGDAADYQRHAASIAAGLGYPPSAIASPGTPSALRPPGYPYLLGAGYATFGIHVVIGRLLNAALGVLAVVLLALLGRALWDQVVGLVAAGLAAVYPPLIALSGSLLSEPLFLVLELGVGLALVSVARDPRRVRMALVAGGLCALAALTRTLGILLLLPCAAVLARSALSWRRRLVSILAMAAAAFVVVVPWTVRNATAFHAFVPISTQDGFTLAGQYNADAGRADDFQGVWRVPLQVASLRTQLAPLYRRPGGLNEAQLDDRLRSDGFAYISRHPSELLIASALDALRMLGLGLNHAFTTTTAYVEIGLPRRLWTLTTVSAQLIAAIALLGIITRVTGLIRFRLGPWWLWAIPVLQIAATVPTDGTPRYRAPADPFLILFAAVTIVAILRWGRSRARAPLDLA
jgi:4-amino-4-deoxy-L-arabinose transferase-like glycosyltransferase